MLKVGQSLTVNEFDLTSGVVWLCDADGELYPMTLRQDHLNQQVYLYEQERAGKMQAAPAVATAAVPLVVHCNDTIRLKAKTVTGLSRLDNYGEWWYVSAGCRGGTCWLISSVSKQPRKQPAKKYIQYEIKKEHDPDFEIVKVCVFPKPFDYKQEEKSTL